MTLKELNKRNPPGKRGLYYNIHKKRIQGLKIRKKGEEGAPSEEDFKRSSKTAKK